jgi:hypothetical protein
MRPEIVQQNNIHDAFRSITNWLAGIDVVMFDQENPCSLYVILQCKTNSSLHFFPRSEMIDDAEMSSVFEDLSFVLTHSPCWKCF